MATTILSIAGKPGLYKLVARGKANLIVESIDERRRRMPAFASDRVTSLADITMYGVSDDKPLMTILAAIRDKEQGKPLTIDYRHCKSDELRAYFVQVFADYDHDRVHDSDIRKLLTWYDILVKHGIADFEDALKPTEGNNISDRK